ncbi:DnaB-like helicase C-terminal domain-containing protein [Nostoc flagelliforme]|uniref:DnaB-like helicase C-terminal domain-containing protein n=1 Tax=Nostoc flagelliforme TaxID=1306274 RepID=UPI003BB18C49
MFCAIARSHSKAGRTSRIVSSGENHVQEIDSILKQLRAIAKQFNCAVLGLAQLKREVDSRSEID